MMKFFDCLDNMIPALRWYHIAFIEISVLGFTLMIAKLYMPLLALDWYWYGLLMIVAALPVWVRIWPGLSIRKLFASMDNMIAALRWYHISLIKISVLGFTLMIAKLYMPLLALDWYWYGLLMIISALPVWVRIWPKLTNKP